MNSNSVDALYYGGFQSYGAKPIATTKPGTKDYYKKEAYGEISNYNKRKIDFFGDKPRWNSVYDKDMIKTIRESDYNSKISSIKQEVMQYEYGQDKILQELACEGKKKNEEKIREKFAQTCEERKKRVNHWQTTYQSDCNQNKGKFQKSEIPVWFKKDYHIYHRTTYKTDHTESMGIYGDNPHDKFSKTLCNSQVDKVFFDNYQVAEGSSKMSNFLPGYAGHIPRDFSKTHDTLITDPYFQTGKTNHTLNYKLRIPRYSGHIPLNSQNYKGNPRPFCLSTESEKFS